MTDVRVLARRAGFGFVTLLAVVGPSLACGSSRPVQVSADRAAKSASPNAGATAPAGAGSGGASSSAMAAAAGSVGMAMASPKPAPSTLQPVAAVDAGARVDAGGSAGNRAAMPTSPPATTPGDPPTQALLYWLDITANSVWRANADGSDAKAIVTGNGISAPDGIHVDVEDGHVYWSNMGSALGGANLATLQRAALDGSGVETILPVGVGNTFKQLTIDQVHHKLYVSDREGAKVWRTNFDGSQYEILVSGHGINQAVGIALDVPRAQFYFTDRNARKIFRANFELPPGQTDANRDDLEELLSFPSGAMPVDLDLDLDKRLIYWTDRGLGTIQRAGMDLPASATAGDRKDIEVLISNLTEPIGISLDLKAGFIYFGQLSAPAVSRIDLDGKNRIAIVQKGAVTGVTVTHVPRP